MTLEIIEDARLESVEEYRLCFSLADAPGCGWAFPCDADGNVDEVTLHPDGLDNLCMCRAGMGRSGRAIMCDGVMCERRTIRIPAIARCRCGARLELASSWLNTCDCCGRDYDGSGTALAPRHHWGEETGEHWANLVAL
jgi:hypothetical protein